MNDIKNYIQKEFWPVANSITFKTDEFVLKNQNYLELFNELYTWLYNTYSERGKSWEIITEVRNNWYIYSFDIFEENIFLKYKEKRLELRLKYGI